MCGIAGAFTVGRDRAIVGKMERALRSMHHRGPDHSGHDIHESEYGAVVLGHARLSIIDLSMAGNQPMLSEDGRYALIFNGEIYNYRELRKELAQTGHLFRSDSDTEVLLAAWMCWGMRSLVRLQGMFAFVVHDRREGVITCVRDAFGIKPFFYAGEGGGFLFASELNALLELMTQRPSPDLQQGYDYLVHGDYDSSERTFINGVCQLRPGHVLQIDLKSPQDAPSWQWWVPSIGQTSKLTFSEATDAVREEFLHNIRLHLRSDVALGAALSGGIDSSAVVCAMRHVEPDLPIHTFSYIASGSALSEESWVDKINAHVSAFPHKVMASGSDLIRDLDNMIRAQGEPFGSTSIYAQYRVFQLARENGVTVTLDGQGADELLAGYSGYPGYRLLSLLSQGQLWQAIEFARSWGKWPGRSVKLAVLELARALAPDGAYSGLRKASGRNFSPDWLNMEYLAGQGIRLQENRRCLDGRATGRRVMEQLAYSLQNRGLPGLLRHGDRNSMRFSVESRVPFLTTSFCDLLYSLPEDYLISGSGQTKSIFRAAMRGIVPDEVLDRRDKIGFATPEKEWLMSVSPVLRQWLSESDEIPFISKKSLLKKFDAVMEGRAPFNCQVWRWVNYVRWYNKTINI